MAAKRFIGTVAALIALCAATAAPAQAQVPSGVTGLALDGRVELAWQPTAGATGYKVYRGTSATTVTTPLMASPLTPPDLSVPASFTDLTATNGTTYFYAVRSITGGVESANSTIVRATARARSCSGTNPVVVENCFPGDSNWDSGLLTGVDAFATATSINKGESAGVKVQAAAGVTVNLEIFRSGYYGGAGGRLVSTLLNVPVAAQPACTNDATTGLVDCANWSVTSTLTTTATWPSGVYLVRVTRPDTSRQTLVPIVVRDDARTSQILYGIPFTTYQAYNYWGGRSLYDDKSTGAHTVAGTSRAVKVSFDRPWQQPHDDILRDWYTRADYPTVAWLERSGYDVAYASVNDLERNGARVRDHRVYIAGAHDEYWSAAMRTAVEQGRDAGTDLFFTGANDVYWKVRFENGVGGQDRVMVNYKSTQSGPADPSGVPTGTWRDPAGANRPENGLLGGMYVGQKNFSYFPLRVSAAQGKDRIWRYTGLDTQATGATASVGSALVGWEWNKRVSNGQEPPGVVTLSGSAVDGDILQDAGRVYAPGASTSEAVKYQAPSGAWVVNTGTNHWNWGLARNTFNEGEPDVRIRQATTNILFDMGAFPETPAADIVLDDPSAPPLVPLKIPAAGATGVVVDTLLRAGFSRPMDASTLTAAKVTLTGPGATPVPVTVAYDATAFTVTLTPSAALALETTYTIRLDGTIKAANGVALGTPVAWSFTTRPPDRTPPSVTVTSPTAGTLVITQTTVNAAASDDTSVSGVQFKVDGNDIGAEDTSAPYSVPWDARALSPGNHTLTAVGRDPAGNLGTSAPVVVNVDPTGLVAAYGFEETAGTGAADSSGKGNPGTLANATRTTAGRFGSALTFNGTNAWVTVPDSSTLDVTTALTMEAWVRPTNVSSWRTVLMKEQPNGLAYGMYANTNSNRPSAHVNSGVEADTRGTAQLAANTWTHLAATYDGTAVRLYVNGALASSAPEAGALVNTSGALRIGGNGVWPEWFAGQIDEVRVYRRVLSAGEITTDMNAAVNPGSIDAVAPSAPGTLTTTGGIGSVRLNWGAATDNVGVARYTVHRSTTAGFTPTAGNLIAEPTGTSYDDTGLAAGTYHYRVIAVDGAGNSGPASNQATGTAAADTINPAVSITAPAAAAQVSGPTALSASASDNVGVVGVQFKVDGANVGAEDTSAPFSVTWDSTSVPNGPHAITAVARDAAGNSATSGGVSVTVNNLPVDASGLVAAYGFEEASGASATDSSTQSNTGTLANATRSTAGRFGSALSFNGTNAWVTVPDATSLDATNALTMEAWVNPSNVSSWRTVLMKEQPNGLAYGIYANTNTNRPSAHVNTSGEVDTRGSAQLAANAWTHLAATYDGAAVRIYVNGVLASSAAETGALVNTSGPLRIGGNGIWPEWFAGLIDEVRIYKRVLSASEIQTDMNTPVAPGSIDTVAPSAPGTLTATGSIGTVQLAWGAATDNLGVARYNVHRSTTAGFTPAAGNRIAQVTGTSYPDAGLSAGTYYYRVIAQDVAGNVGPASNEASGAATADTTAPTVSVTAPAGGATVSGTVALAATAADNVGVASVQFKVGSGDVGAAVTSAPYTRDWATAALPNGSYTITAVARDAAGNTRTSDPVTVTVANAPPDTSGLVAAYGFEEASGTAVTDSSSRANHGTIAGATRSASGRFGAALSFNGTSAWVTVPDSTSLDLTTGMTLEAWVNPSALTAWRTVMMKESGDGLAYGLYANTNTNRPSAHVNTGSESDTRGSAQLVAGTWTHLAATYDGTTLRIYVNGTQASATGVGGPALTTTGPLRIGGNNVWGEYLAGLIDEVRVYNKVLTATEVQADMNRAVVVG